MIKIKKSAQKNPCTARVLSKRQKGVEPSSSAWKAEIMSRYMTAANVNTNISNKTKLVNHFELKIRIF